MKKVFAILVIFLLAGLAIYNNQLLKNGSPDQLPRVGFSAPHFDLEGLDGNRYEMSGPRAKPLVINFWASWCGPCRMEAPDLREVYLQYQQDIDFYAVNLTAGDSVNKATAFVEAFELPFPILLDNVNKLTGSGEVEKKYQIFSVPTTFFVDTQGVIRRQVIGVVDRATLERLVKEMIK